MADHGSSVPYWTIEDLGLLMGALLPCLGLGAVVVSVLRAVAPAWFSDPAVQALVFQSTIYIFVMLVLYALVSIRHGMPLWSSLGWTLEFRGAWLCVLVAPALAISVSLLGALLRAPAIPTPVDDLISGQVSLAVVALFAVVLGPLFEELLFRGFFFALVRRLAGAWAAIFGAAIPFALLHGVQYEWSWQHLLLVGFAGVVFGFARYRTGSTAASALLHAGYNFTFFAAYLLQRG